jgi:hypothetical protein
VLLPTYAITDNIIFNAEIEFEHAGSGTTMTTSCMARPKSTGLDRFQVQRSDQLARSASISCRSAINQHHEPTQFIAFCVELSMA